MVSYKLHKIIFSFFSFFFIYCFSPTQTIVLKQKRKCNSVKYDLNLMFLISRINSNVLWRPVYTLSQTRIILYLHVILLFLFLWDLLLISISWSMHYVSTDAHFEKHVAIKKIILAFNFMLILFTGIQEILENIIISIYKF